MKTMKKILIISIFIALAFMTGCVEKDVLSPEGKLVDIRFDTPVVNTLTKVHYGEIGTPYSTDESFTVFAVLHDIGFEGWSTNATPYISGSEFSYNSGHDDNTVGSGGWISATAYYWPFEGVLTFAGYSPSNAHSSSPGYDGDGKGQFSYGADGLTITNFSVNADASFHQDVMYGKRVYNRTTSTGGTNATYDGVDMEFQHTLASIQFNIQLDKQYGSTTHFELKTIEVCEVKYKGSFKENIVETVPATYSSSPAWVLEEDMTPQPYKAFDRTSDNMLNLDSNYKTGISDNYITLDEIQGQNDLIVMPQVFNKGGVVNYNSHIRLEYVVTIGSSKFTQEARINLKDLSEEWLSGNRYIYNITIGYDNITVGATSEWVDVNVTPTIK